jgi:hypothetical protein
MKGNAVNMTNRNIQLTAILFVVALALTPIAQAVVPDGGPSHLPANDAQAPDDRPVITIHSTDNVIRGKTGSFVLNMKPALMLGATYVNFSIGGTAAAGVDYVQPLSPAYVGQAGYGVILIQTLQDPRGFSNRQSYSVVITLEAGLAYALGVPRSATMWIKP